MLADNVLGWEIVLKISYLPSKLRFSAKYSFFGQSLSRGHYQPTYQPPEGVYLLNTLLAIAEFWSEKPWERARVYTCPKTGIGTSDVFGILWKTSEFFGNLQKWLCPFQKSQHSQDKYLMPISQKKLAGIQVILYMCAWCVSRTGICLHLTQVFCRIWCVTFLYSTCWCVFLC